MIARVWRGATLGEDADAYAAYLEESGMTAARGLPGSRGTIVLRRLRAGHAEFETILLFDSIDDVKAFAGDDLDEAVFFPEDDRYLVERDLEVSHFEADVRIQGPGTG
jgi:antibiotic biosynthesis monooxygenase (ABM) superfamily enzyme